MESRVAQSTSGGNAESNLTPLLAGQDEQTRFEHSQYLVKSCLEASLDDDG